MRKLTTALLKYLSQVKAKKLFLPENQKPMKDDR